MLSRRLLGRADFLDEQTLTSYLLSISVIFLSLPYPAHSDIRRVMASDIFVLFSYPRPLPRPPLPRLLARNTALRKLLPPATRGDDRLKEMLVSLNTAGFLSRSTQSADIGGFKRSWEVHIVTRKGQDWLSKDEAAREPIMLPMPQVMIDAAHERKRYTHTHRQTDTHPLSLARSLARARSLTHTHIGR